ncbi:RagB/SusD family nutrient uptake outer membrane protein [Sphingobacterium luzhongxinii]|uniref:RagB/SusD family nutrient uptake outer membrane protein n=1 Tax=Sphingobacterium luzhongxinii TaxID=2654181 RepID=UPI0013DB33C2|nr:RagB/SusD family nutrient uptake outer membrane protein [Sphingobacterium sp. xlx-73]
MKIIIKTLLYTSLSMTLFTSCEKFLDELPDNRAELDSEKKITGLLVSAYSSSAYIASTEYSSDNVDDYGFNNPYSDRLVEQIFRWQDVIENSDESPKKVWEGSYKAISSANQALAAIEEMGNPTSLSAQRGEALITRAYNHFILVNIFAQHFTKEFAASDLGVTYMLKPESTLNPHYERNSVKEVYEYIVKDLEEGLPLINDATYKTPKFHFTKAASYAFAARVALYMQEWQKAVDYANIAIGANPQAIMRDNVWIQQNGVGEVTDAAKFYTASTVKSNLLLSPCYSVLGTYFGPYRSGSRFAHGARISNTETFLAAGPFGSRTSGAYKVRVYVYSAANVDKHLVPRITYQFEMTDPVSQTGYAHTVFAPFTTEETMLVRAEALIHLKQYDAAAVDMKRWVDNSLTSPPANFNVSTINTWANGIAYYTPEIPTAKKKLEPEFSIETGTQENMLHALLYIRRLETMHTGLRWFDVKRYGIEVVRRVISSGIITPETSTKLIKRDKRAALQLPADVITAGVVGNPR